MKHLKDILTEGILADPEDSLSKTAEEIMYPAPTVKDFKRTVKWGERVMKVEWHCPEIVQRYINLYYGMCKTRDFDGITGFVYMDELKTNKIIQIELRPIEEWRTGIVINGLDFGQYVNNKNAKQHIIDLFNYISKHPEFMKTLIEHNNQCNRSWKWLNVSKLIKQ